ncbi:MAG: hypothetical protein AB7F59_01535 [Bdellovibrionales bacterium]
MNGRLVKQPLSETGAKNRSLGLLTIGDSADVLGLILRVLPNGRNSSGPILKEYADRLIDIGIAYEAVDANFLRKAAQTPTLRQGANLVTFLSEIEFVVEHATRLADIDARTYAPWLRSLVAPVQKEFAEAVTKSGFALPQPTERLYTGIESTSAEFSNLGGSLKVIILKSKPTVNDLLLLKAVINLVDYGTFMKAYTKMLSKGTSTIAELPSLFGLDQKDISKFLNANTRESQINDFTVSRGGSVMKTEILRGAIKDLIEVKLLALPEKVLTEI